MLSLRLFVASGGWIDISWTNSLGGLPHTTEIAVVLIGHRALAQTRPRPPEGQHNQEVTEMRNEVLSLDIHLVFAAQDRVWSRAQLEKQAAAEEPAMERTFGKLAVDRQHRLHAKRSRLSTSSQHISKDRQYN